MSEKKPNWKIASDLKVIGEKKELESLPGFWIIPRRYSKRGDSAISACASQLFVKNQVIRKQIIDRYTQTEADKISFEITPEIEAEILNETLSKMDAENFGQVDVKKLKIFYGIHSQNLTGEKEGDAPSMELAEELSDNVEVFDEIIKIIDDKNSPLV